MTDGLTREDASLDSLVAGVVDDFRERQRRGEKPDVEEYAARHPEAAALLRKVLATFQLLDGSALASGGESGVRGPTTDDAPLSGTLGDFRLIREVGRGGMGIVYEAEQISLGRRVALKVLPFAAKLDPRQLQRFHNEARAAASLRHEHIVPVYAVGQERGIHFFAMQFIDGQTMADLIRQQQGGATPATINETTAKPVVDTEPVAGKSTEPMARDAAYFRRVAEWGIQAAEALEHAHSLGIVHRDIKPSNLMFDARGQLWVADFGLARRAADSDLTLSGDLLGTLRYMSPEQALAKHDLVDHRSDVYSLGATLYELLTLHTAVDGDDRQEILRQITQTDVKNLRQRDRRIPADLETIVLKALAKEPEGRYATAKEFANDLRRYLAHEPIRARRPTLRQRTVKWGRRNRPLVLAGGVASVFIVLVLGIALGSLWQAESTRRQAAEKNAHEVFKQIQDLHTRKEWPKALELAPKAEFFVQAAGNASEVEPRINDLLRECAWAIRLEEIPLRPVTNTTNTLAFDYKRSDAAYTQAFKDFGIDVWTQSPDELAGKIQATGIALEIVAALDNWAGLCRYFKKTEQCQQLLAIAAKADPNLGRNRIRQALAAEKVGVAELLSDDELATAPAATFVLLSRFGGTSTIEMVEILRKGQRKYPSEFWINYALGEALLDLTPPRSDEAIGYFRVAATLRSHSPIVQFNLGVALLQSGYLDEAITNQSAGPRAQRGHSTGVRQPGSRLQPQKPTGPSA